MISRRAFLGTQASSLLAAWVAAEAQQKEKVYRIGYFSSGSPVASPSLLEAFRQGLRELGWIEGQNIDIESRFAEGRFDQLPGLAAELVRLKVDVIVAVATPTAAVVKKASATIPIVGVTLGDPVGLGLIASLARPGGNVTGLAYSVGAETIVKGLELLKEVVPKVHRVAILSNPANPYHAIAIRDAKSAARSLAVQLQFQEAQDPAGFDGTFASMVRERAGALVVVPDSMFQLYRTRIADLAARSRLPAAYGVKEYVEAGGLMSYGPSLSDIWRRAATYVDKILKGAKPGDLPVEQPTKFELVINLKTAKALGLTIPPSLLARADQVIE